MADIARLGMAVDSSGLVQARKAAKKLAEEAVVTDKKIRELKEGTKNLTRENANLKKGLTNLRGTVKNLEKGINKERQAVEKLKSSETQLVEKNKQVEMSLKNTNKALSNTKSRLIGAAAAMVGVGSFSAGIASATKLLADFEFALARVGVVSGASATQMIGLEAEIRKLGATTIHSASAAADAARSFAQSGFEVDQIVGALGASLNLATSAMIDTGEAADITGKIMNTFKISAYEASEITDTLAMVANSSQADIVALADGFRYAGGISKGFGESVADLAAVLGILNAAGQDNTLAGTGFRQALVQLSKGTDKTNTLLKDYGLTLKDVSLSTNRVVDIIGKLNNAGVTTEAIYKNIRVQGASALAALVAGYDDLVKLTDIANKSQGTGAKINAALNDTLTGSVKGLLSVTSELVLQQTGFKDALRDTSDSVTNVLRVFAGYEDTIETGRESAEAFASTLELIGKVAIPLMAGKMVSMLIPALASSSLGFRAAATEMQLMTGASRGASIAMTGLAASSGVLRNAFYALGGPTGLVIATITALGFLITKETAAEAAADRHAETLAKVRGQYDNTTEAINAQSEALNTLTTFKNVEALKVAEQDIIDITKQLDKAFEQSSQGALGFSSDALGLNLALGSIYKDFKDGKISISEFNDEIRTVGIETDNLKSVRDVLYISEPLEAATVDAKKLNEELKELKGNLTLTPLSVAPESKKPKKTGAAVIDPKTLKDRIDNIRESLKSEEDLENESYVNRFDAIVNSEALRLISTKEANALIEQEQKRHQDRITEIDENSIVMRNKFLTESQAGTIDAVGGIFGNLATLMSQGGKDAFEAYKVFAIAQAGVSGAMAVIQALAAPAPPPIPQILAATTGALVATQMAMISQQSYSGRALGGQVSSGTSYLVGERGPELLTMGNNSGNITPNNKMGGGQSINNTNVFQISAGVSGQVQAEIMRLAPAITAQAQAGVEAAMYKGGSMSRAVGRRR